MEERVDIMFYIFSYWNHRLLNVIDILLLIIIISIIVPVLNSRLNNDTHHRSYLPFYQKQYSKADILRKYLTRIIMNINESTNTSLNRREQFIYSN